MKEVKEDILSNQITLVITSPNSRTLSIINLINELSIKEKYKTILFSLNISCNYYLQKLISFLSGINNRLITKYFYPHTMFGKYNGDKINRDRFLNSIEEIQSSNILMNSEKHVVDKDYIDYILDYSENDVLIIDDLYAVLDKTKYGLDEILTRVKKKQDIHLVLFVKTRCKEKVVRQFAEIITNYIFVDGCNYMEYKDINVSFLSKTLKLRLNKMNQIMEVNNEE